MGGGARFSLEKRDEVEGEVVRAGATRLIEGADLLVASIGATKDLEDWRVLPDDSRRLNSALNSTIRPSR